MQARNRQRIQPQTLETLMNRVYDPRRLGGSTRAIRIIGRTPYAEAWKEFFDRDLRTSRDLQDLLSSMLEEEALSLLDRLDARMPDISKDTVEETVRRLSKVA